MNDVAWREKPRFERDVRARLAVLDQADERVLSLIDLLPLPEGLLTLAEQLGETEQGLRRERRASFGPQGSAASVAQGRELAAKSGDPLQFPAADFRKFQRITGRESAVEVLLQVIDWKMFHERTERIKAMGRA